MTDEYRLIVTRQKDGKYTCELMYNGKRDSYTPLNPLPAICQLDFLNRHTGTDLNSIEKLEIIISGGKLK